MATQSPLQAQAQSASSVAAGLLQQFNDSKLRGATKKKTVGDIAIVTNDETEVADNISDNFFYQTMHGDLSETKKAEIIRDKIDACLGDPLTLKPEDIVHANAVFADFENYYTHLQDAALDTDLAAIKGLMDRIKNSVTPQMKSIINGLTSTNSSINGCSALLEVLKVARERNTTVEDLAKAVKDNDRLVNDIADHKANIARLEDRVAQTVSAVAYAVQSCAVNKGWFGVPTQYKNAVDMAKAEQTRVEAALETAKAELTELESKLITDLEEGPLKILRSYDITEDGMKTQIESAANDTINVVESIRASVKVLLDRVGKTQVSIKGIVDDIANTRIERTLLISSMTETYKANQVKIDAIGAKVAELTEQLEACAPDSVEAGRIRIDLMKQTANQRGIVAFGERINTLLQMMKTSDATSVISSSDAERVLESVRNNKDGFNTLYSSTLPTTTQGMRLVLDQFVDAQDQEFRQAIGNVTGDLSKTAEGTAERAIEQQEAFQKQKVADIKAIIARLRSTQDLIGRALESTVNSAVEQEQANKEMSAEGEILRNRVDMAGEIRAQVRDRVRASEDEAAQATS